MDVQGVILDKDCKSGSFDTGAKPQHKAIASRNTPATTTSTYNRKGK